MTRMTFTIILLILFSLILIGLFTGLFAVGGYPYAQRYEFSKTQDNLDSKIELLRKNSNTYIKVDTISDSFDQFGNFHLFFYSVSNDEIIHIMTQNTDNSPKARLYLIGYNKGKNLGNWKLINYDFNRKENILRKKIFCDQILDKLGLDYRDKGNSMWVFWK
jgi:hypothetical protein